MNVETRAGVAIALAIVAIAGCSSGKSNVTSTTTTVAAPRVTTSTSPRRRTETTSTTAVAAPTTTTATQTSTSSFSAVSATFVSPNHGFVLASDGHLDETTDGGHGWRRVGSLPVRGEAPRIRYIDSADGFAFTSKRGPLYVTHDSGATWTVTPTPFTNVYDLAIARGTIDVTAFQQSPKPVFRIWTSPIAHLVWKAAPATLAVGAGPIPSQQIVLNGGKGWILSQNRLVIAGARLNANNWASWSPACLREFGPAYLSASTGSDLVASCNEGEWGGNFKGVTPTTWFSHDGGTTFARTIAPVFGPVLSPNSQTAIVVGNSSLQRTTDGGATWTDVGSIPTGDTTDWGFTTSTQGFVIRQGEMLMTRDAGASWQPVTLP